MYNLLVELGTEELPVGILDVVYSDLKPKAEEAFRKARLSFSEVKVEATPRRISLYIEGLAARQKDEQLELSGPSKEKAYNPDGTPTQALEGFLKSKGASLKDVQMKETPKGLFVVVQKKNVGKPLASVAPEVLQEIFSSLNFPKNMRWEKTGFRFPRPLRWVVAVLDKKVLNFSFASLKASNKSYGHRFLSPKVFTIPSADWNVYKKLLRKAHVILELEERKAAVAKSLTSQFKQKSFDAELLHITTQLTEEPFLFDGSFKKEYLELPKEVLASCMKKNQKIFACYGSDGKLTGKFVAVLNGKRAGIDGIRKGYENVLESRLKDARYFYKADTKEPFEKKLQLLEQVTYLGKLGNMLQKTERMEKLAEKICELTPSVSSPNVFVGDLENTSKHRFPPKTCGNDKEKKQDLKRAARLSKIDLMTHLVYEFPDLQGIVGREYAIAAGEKKEVAEAIGTQYSPKNLTQNYREVREEFSELGALLGIADRLDLLVGAFGTGIVPTGSQDPYALRRAGGAVVKLLRAFSFRFSLRKTIEASASLYGNVLTVPVKEVTDKLMKFFEERLVFELQVKAGTREHEILQAVTRSGFDDLADIYERYAQLTSIYKKDQDSFIKTAKVIERTANITKGVKEFSEINPELLTENSEKALFEAFEHSRGAIKGLVEERNYEKATHCFAAAFYAPLNAFFEQVMVNVEDTKIRSNRQALMRKINLLYSEKVADLSVLSRLDQG